MRHRSLTNQIIGIVLAAQILCALLLATAAILREAHTHLRTLDVRLQGHSDSLLGAIQDAEDANSTVQVDPKELRIPSGDVFAVYNQGGKMLGSSVASPNELTTRGIDGFRSIHVHGVRYRVLQREGLRVIDRAEFGKEGLQRPVTIVYASPETRVWHEIFEAVSFSLIAILVAAVVTMACVAFFLRRALLPISDLAKAASSISPPALKFHPPDSVLRIRELRPLADVLTEAVHRLREAFEKEQRFVGDAAHELKTAIAVVRSSIQVLMLRRRTADEYAAGLERLLQDNIRGEELVAQMLLLSRLEESTSQTIALQNLTEIVKAVLLQLNPIAEERQLKIVCDCSQGILIRISPERAQVLISNIILNAIQSSHPGNTIDVRVVSQAGSAVTFEVQDHGSGIGKDALPHVFERFYREDRSRSRNTGGTGLGLAICKSIADEAGASISIASELGKGTKVTVVFSAA